MVPYETCRKSCQILDTYPITRILRGSTLKHTAFPPYLTRSMAWPLPSRLSRPVLVRHFSSTETKRAQSIVPCLFVAPHNRRDGQESTLLACLLGVESLRRAQRLEPMSSYSVSSASGTSRYLAYTDNQQLDTFLHMQPRPYR